MFQETLSKYFDFVLRASAAGKYIVNKRMSVSSFEKSGYKYLLVEESDMAHAILSYKGTVIFHIEYKVESGIFTLNTL